MPKDEGNVSRRDFLKAAGTVGFGALLSSVDSLSHAQKNLMKNHYLISQFQLNLLVNRESIFQFLV